MTRLGNLAPAAGLRSIPEVGSIAECCRSVVPDDPFEVAGKVTISLGVGDGRPT